MQYEWEQCKVQFDSSGKLNVKDNELEDMLKEATGPINFTMFLNLFGEKLHGEKLHRVYKLRLIHWWLLWIRSCI